MDGRVGTWGVQLPPHAPIAFQSASGPNRDLSATVEDRSACPRPDDTPLRPPRVRSGADLRYGYRCDAPSCRRSMQMQIRAADSLGGA